MLQWFRARFVRPLRPARPSSVLRFRPQLEELETRIAPSPNVDRLEYIPATERLEAFRLAMGRLRLPVIPEYVVCGDYEWSEASAIPIWLPVRRVQSSRKLRITSSESSMKRTPFGSTVSMWPSPGVSGTSRPSKR